MEPSWIFSIKSDCLRSKNRSWPVAASIWTAQKLSLKINFTIPLSFHISMRSSSSDKSAETESSRILDAFLYKLSIGNQSLKSVDVPVYDLAWIKPELCFFHPSKIPVTEMKKKKTNKKAPVVLWIFLKRRIRFACLCFLMFLIIFIVHSHWLVIFSSRKFVYPLNYN